MGLSPRLVASNLGQPASTLSGPWWKPRLSKGGIALGATGASAADAVAVAVTVAVGCGGGGGGGRGFGAVCVFSGAPPEAFSSPPRPITSQPTTARAAATRR